MTAGPDEDVLLGVLSVRHGLATPEQVIQAQTQAGSGTRLIDALAQHAGWSESVRSRLEAHLAEWRSGSAGEVRAASGWLAADGEWPTDAPHHPTLDAPTVEPTHRGADLLSTPGPVDARRPVGAVTPEAPGRYDSDVRELGRGGIGRVLAVYDRHLGRRVAIKELLPAVDGPAIAESDLVRFLREARVTGQLEHPNIVPVYELGQRADGTLYYSMKVVRGRTMRSALRDARTLQDRMKLLAHYVDLANAIAYAHSRGVVHRDIKPDNVMLGEFGETIVLDWGLTKVRGEPEDVMGATVRRQRQLVDSDIDSATRAGDVLGTPAYMSPEQAAGDVDRVDELSDVWSLGAVLFELLAGRPPFRGRAAETLWKVAEGDVPRVADVEASAPRDLAAVAEKALSKRREDRYPNAAALVTDVEAFMTGQRVGAYEYTAWELMRKFAVEHRAAATAVFSILFVIIVGTALTLAAYQRALAERQRALVAEQRAEEARAASEANERRASDNLSTALYERAKLLNEQGDHGAAGVYAAGALVNSPWVPSSPFAHPDLEERDARLQAEKQLPLRSAMFEALVGQRLTWRYALPSAEVCGLDLSDDGRYVAASARDGTLTLWDLETRAPVWQLPVRTCPRFVDIDPNGRWVAHTDIEDPIHLIGFDGRPIRSVSTGPGADWVFRFSPDGRWLFGANSEGTVARLDVETWEVRNRVRVTAPRAIGSSNDGRLLAVGTRWGSVLLFDAITFELEGRFSDLESTVYAVAFSPDDRRLAAAGFEGAIVVRGVDGSGEPVRWPGVRFIRDLVWTGDHVLASGQELLRLWSAFDGHRVQVARRDPSGIRLARVGPNGRNVVTAGHGPHIDVWNLGRGRRELLPHESRVLSAAISTDGRLIGTVDDAARVRLWDAATGELRWRAHEPTAWRAMFFGSELFTVSSRGRVKAWDAAGRSRVLQAETPERHGSHVGLDVAEPVGRAAWVSAGARAALYDARSERVDVTPPLLPEQSTAVALSDDGRRLAVSDLEGNIAVWDVAEERIAWRRTEAHAGIANGLAFTPDGRRLVSSGYDARIRWWDALTGDDLGAVTGHGQWVNTVEISADGRYLLSTSDDGTARLWDARTRLPLLEARADDNVAAATFDETRGTLLIGLDAWLAIVPRELPELEWSASRLLEHARETSGLALDGFALVPVSPR